MDDRTKHKIMDDRTKHKIMDDRTNKILNLGYVIAVIANLASITLTIYLMRMFPVGEANFLPAMVYSFLGYPAMYLIAIAIWSGLFLFVKLLRKYQGEDNILLVKGGLVVIALLITFIDLIHNIDLLGSILVHGI